MKKFIVILLAALAISLTPGCGVYSEEHKQFNAQGVMIDDQKVFIVRNALDSTLKDLQFNMPDKTSLKIGSSTSSADPNVLNAVSQGFQALTTLGSAVLKVLPL